MPIKGTETVLAVDDDADLLDFVKEALTPLGYRMLTAKDSETALRLAEETEESIDLLLTDVIMPRMNGIDLAQEFMVRYPDTKIVFMSGFICPSMAQHNTPRIDKAFVQKPFTRNALVQKMRDILDEAESFREE